MVQKAKYECSPKVSRHPKLSPSSLYLLVKAGKLSIA